MATNNRTALDPTSKMSPDDFAFLYKIGQGAYGRVFQVRKKRGVDKNKFYAVKVIYKHTVFRSDRRMSAAMSERNILTVIKHPFLVDLKYAFQTETKLYLVMSLVNGGDLKYLLNRETVLQECTAIFYMEEIVLALQYLHSLNILYRDLKPSNTLIDRNGHVKLTDFGLSKENVVHGVPTYSICGTLHYSAPEVVNKSGHGKEADWWALGILFYEMLMGTYPYEDEDKEILKQKILKGEHSMSFTFIENDAQDLIKKLLKSKVRKRLGTNGAEEIKQHKFFKYTDWEKVIQCSRGAPFVPRVRSDDDVCMFNRRCTEQPVLRSVESQTVSLVENEYFKNFDYVSPSIADECNNNHLKCRNKKK